MPVSTPAVPRVSAEAAPDVTIAASRCSSVAIRCADLVVQLVEHHVVLRGVVDRLHDFGRHQRGGHVRVGAGGVDEGADAELPEVVALRRLRAAAAAAGRRSRRRSRPPAARRRWSRENVFGSESSPYPLVGLPGGLATESGRSKTQDLTKIHNRTNDSAEHIAVTGP